jgi:PAS domain S-box-containing protein
MLNEKQNAIEDRELTQLDLTNEFEALFEFATEGILISDNKGLITKINPNGAKLFGYKAEELVGQLIEKLIPGRLKKRHVHHRSGFMGNPHARSMGKEMDLFGLKKDGSEFPIELSLSPFISGDSQFVMAFIIDISERKAMELKEKNYRKSLEKEVEDRTLILKEAIKKLEKTKAELDRALTREKELNVMKSRFISIASHEFRTPLSTILSSLNLLNKYTELGIVDKREKHALRIKNSIKLLTDILDDILSVNKIEEGKVIPKPCEFLITEFITQTISEVKGVLKTGQEIVFIPPANPLIVIYQDKKLLCHVLMNLLTNAAKFSTGGQEIEVETAVNAESFAFTVKDSGIGIPEKSRKDLFNRFFRGDNVEQIQGTGLGLSIVAQYTALLQGTVTFESEEGKGSEFTVTVPRNLK